MNNIPVEIQAQILSQIDDAKTAMAAYNTCTLWRRLSSFRVKPPKQILPTDDDHNNIEVRRDQFQLFIEKEILFSEIWIQVDTVLVTVNDLRIILRRNINGLRYLDLTLSFPDVPLDIDLINRTPLTSLR